MRVITSHLRIRRLTLSTFRYHSAVRVRFAPSPTGELHLGGLRTALYNYLFARSHNGKFLLRIEDTDQTRLVPGSVGRIHNILNHFGLNCDEGPEIGGDLGPYVQSQRLPFYKEAVDQLIDSGHAYRCFCSEQRLAILRKDALRQNAIPKYDRKCRSIDSETSRQRANDGELHVVRFKLDKQTVSFKDEVFGDVSQCLDESDMVLMKSDGFPTYHLANVVDDKNMKISHVIRGMEWLSSTGKHEVLYRALNCKPPNWVHLSLITRDGKKKLSKRDKDAFVDYYDKELGVLPLAVLNLMIRNGSGIRNFDSTRLYSLEDMFANFDLAAMGRRNLQLDSDWLARYGTMAFGQTSEKELEAQIRQRIRTDLPHAADVSSEYLQKVIAFLKANEEKFCFLSSLTKGDFRWFLTRPQGSEKLLRKVDRDVADKVLQAVLDKDGWNLDGAKSVAADLGLPYYKVLHAIRLTIIDSDSGPPIAELISFFGEHECRTRIQDMLNKLREQKEHAVGS